MKRAKSSLLLLFCILFLASGVSAQTQKGTSAAGGKTKITFWFFPQFINIAGYESNSKAFGDWEKFLVSEFNKANPDIEVVPELQPWEGGVDKVNVAIAGGNPPDIVLDYLGRTGGWYYQGAGIPLDNLVSQKAIDDIIPSFKDLYMINGKLHAYPIFAWVQMQLFNKFLFDKYGIGNALPPLGTAQSMDDFRNRLVAAKKAFPKGVYPYGLGCASEQGDYVWWEFIWGFGGQLFDKNGKVVVNSPQTVEALKFLLSLDKDGLLAPGTASMTSSDVLKLMYSNKIGGWAGNRGHYTTMAAAVKDGTIEGPAAVSLYPFPTKPGISPSVAIGPTGFIVMTKDQAKQKAAAEFIEFYIQGKYLAASAKMLGQLPATKSIAALNIYKGDALGETMQDILAKYPSGNFGLSNPNYNKIRTELGSQLQAMFSGMKTPEKTAADLEAGLKKILGQ